MQTKYDKRYIANIVIEAKTPLKVGSSDLDMLQDSPVQKDFNELPMILGTSIAGVLRREFEEEFANDIFGDEKGSRVIISNALLCDKDMKVHEKLLLQKNDFLSIYDTLPIREHTAITDKGVAKENSKFDEEVVYKGSRFKFRVELIGDASDEGSFKKLLNAINTNTFRLGGGTTKGFGDIGVVDKFSSYGVYEFISKEYREKTSSLNTTYDKSLDSNLHKNTSYTTYTLNLKPDDFFMFGSGFGDDDADMTPVYERVVDYDKGELSNEMILIPASSIKGAISHRTTYHYNKNKKLFIGNSDAKETITEVFGEKKDSKNSIDGSKGKILISDCFIDDTQDTKVFEHVSIDRFTGGGIDGALFQEKTISGGEYKIEMLLDRCVKDDELKAFEDALLDITTGMLPLGGATTKGHGIFSGELLKDGVKYEKK